MEIVPLGVGDAFAKTLYQTNFVVRPAEGEPFLIDCGHTASRALNRLGEDPKVSSVVVLSHLHADHIGGLEELGFTGRFRWGERPVLHVPEDLLVFLWDHALMAGMGQRLEGGEGPYSAELSTYFDVRPVAGGAPFTIGSVEIRPFPTPHVEGRPSWGFLLGDRATGGSALLTCDTRFEPKNLYEIGRDTAAVFHDCQLSGGAATIHATLDELLTLPTQWQQKIRLVHYCDDWREWQGRTGVMQFAREGETYRF